MSKEQIFNCDPIILNRVGLQYRRTKNYDQAEFYYRKAVDLGYNMAMYNLALLYAYYKIDHCQAEIFFKKAIARGVDDAEKSLCILYRLMNRDEDAFLLSQKYHTSNTQQITTEIQGPEIFYMGKHDQRQYYLFGDVHEGFTSSSCSNSYDITEVLDLIFEKARGRQKYVDFYIEQPYRHKIGSTDMITKPTDYLTKIIDKYASNTKRPIEANLSYPNVRFHYTDIRWSGHHDFNELHQLESNYTGHKYAKQLCHWFMIDLEKLFFEDQASIYKRKEIYYELLKRFLSDELDIKLLKIYLTSSNYTTDITEWINEFSNHEYISRLKSNNNHIYNRFILATIGNNDKTVGNQNYSRIAYQLKALVDQGDEIISNHILEFFLSEYMETREQTVGAVNKCGSILSSYHQYLKGDLSRDTVTIKLFDFKLTNDYPDSYLMDVYTLARMFRRFPNSNHVVSDTVVIYAGCNHIERYADFFKSKLSTTFQRHQSSVGKVRCIEFDISSIL